MPSKHFTHITLKLFLEKYFDQGGGGTYENTGYRIGMYVTRAICASEDVYSEVHTGSVGDLGSAGSETFSRIRKKHSGSGLLRIPK